MTRDEQMDLWLWSQGVRQWNTEPYSRRSTVPHELDYLRGIHCSAVLAHVAAYLSRRTGRDVRLRTMWQDKHVYVKPAIGARRELADVAVILTEDAKGHIARQAMWLLQAKIAATPSSPFSGRSSQKEIELFEGSPSRTSAEFQLLRERKNNATIGPIFPRGAFYGPEYWAFLTLQRDPSRPGSRVMRERWPGSTTRPLNHRSLFRSLVDVVEGKRGKTVTMPAASGDHWSVLFELLMAHAQSSATTNFARSSANPNGEVLQQHSALQRAVSLHQMAWPWRLCGERHACGSGPPTSDVSFASSDSFEVSTPWTELDRALQLQAFGPPDGPRVPSARTDDPGPPEMGLPFVVFLDVSERRGERTVEET